MERRQLGKTDLSISRIGFGCSRIGGFTAAGARRGAVIKLLQSASQAGINLFDTADAYADGDSEVLLGEAFATRRHEVIFCTKGGYTFDEHIGHKRPWAPLQHGLHKLTKRARGKAQFVEQDFSAAYLTRAVEKSLRRLRTDYIDLYQLHAPRTTHAWDEQVIDALRNLRSAGKIRYFGVGLESLDDVERWLDYEDLASIQIPFGILDQEALIEALPKAQARGTGVLVRGVFGGGWVNTRLTDGELSRRTDKWRKIMAYRQLARERDLPLHSMALKFALHPPGVTGAIVGMHSEVHLQRSLRLLDGGALGADVLRYIRCVDEFAPLGR